MTDISVIIPARDPEPAQLAAQLDALAAQDGDLDFEIIVVDNGSLSPLRDIVPDRAGSAPVRVVEAPFAAGINVARVAGTRAAAADRMVCCDSDDIVSTGWLAAAHRELVAGGDVIVGGPVRPFREVVGDSGPAHPGDSLADVAGRPFVSGCNIGFTRGVIERTGGFDESWPSDGSAEDLDFSWRCAEAGVEARFAADMRVEYRLRTDVRGVLRQRRFYGRGDIRFSDRHGWPEGRSGCRRRVIGEVKGILWYLPTAVRAPRGGWHLARRVGLVVGHLEGLLRPIDRSPVRGATHDLREPGATVVLGPLRDRHQLESTIEELAHHGRRLDVVAIVDGTAPESPWPATPRLPVRIIHREADGAAKSRNEAARTSHRDLLVFIDTGPVDLGALDAHLAALATHDVSVGRRARWVTTRRLGRHLVPDVGALGVRRIEFDAVGGFCEELDETVAARDLGLRLSAAGLRIADLGVEADGGNGPRLSTAFAAARRAALVRRLHPQLPFGSICESTVALAGGRLRAVAAALGYACGRVAERGRTPVG